MTLATTMDARAWLQLAQYWVFTAGMLGIVVGLAVERLAKGYGWSTVKRCVPAIAVAVILAVLFAAHQSGRLPSPSAATETAQVRKGVAFLAYCDGWFYYLDMLCWVQN